jgi:hypothetical protein
MCIDDRAGCPTDFFRTFSRGKKAGMRAGNFCGQAPQFNPSEKIGRAPGRAYRGIFPLLETSRHFILAA